MPCQEDYNVCMKRFLPSTALAIACLLSISLHGQMRGSMGGGRGFGGSPRGSSGFRSGGPGFSPGFRSGGPRFSPGFRSGAPGGVRTFAPAARPGGGPRGFAPGPARSSVGFHSFARGGRVFSRFPDGRFGFRRFHNRFFFRDRFFFPDCFGCFSPFFSPFFFGGGLFFGDPFFPAFGGDYYGGYGPPPPPEPVVSSDNSTNVQLATEIQRLSDEVEYLRDEESRRSENRPPANPGASLTAKEPAALTIFVFRDGHRISTQNYALAGQTLWIFNENTARKISLSELDVAATEKVNAANGVEIHLPEPSDKQ
jgi:hypothetical protein